MDLGCLQAWRVSRKFAFSCFLLWIYMDYYGLETKEFSFPLTGLAIIMLRGTYHEGVVSFSTS